jgi:peptidoglycan hydrolase-like protein with peptidoglycan-binding domain
MARVFVSTSIPTIKVLYSVDRDVGPGCTNDKRDVELVQFFLKAASKPGGGLPGIQPPGATPIKIDGVFGPKTAAYIKHYQAAGEGAAVVDGKVSPVQGGSVVGSVHGKPLTIAHLNAGYAKRFGTDKHLRIDTDPDFPVSLRAAIFL